MPDFSWAGAVREYQLHPSPLAAQCRSGDDDACMVLLDWDQVRPAYAANDAQLEEWLDRMDVMYPDGLWRSAAADCGAALGDLECLASISLEEWETRLFMRAFEMQRALFRTALETGGSDGLEALAQPIEAPTTASLLEALAQQPLTETLAEWRTRMDEYDPERSLPADERRRPFVWAAIFGLASLTSSRWRFG